MAMVQGLVKSPDKKKIEKLLVYYKYQYTDCILCTKITAAMSILFSFSFLCNRVKKKYLHFLLEQNELI
jgi:hypothetical protein